MSDEEQFDEAASEELLRFFQAAVAEALRTEDGEAFLAWVREEAPRGLPALFAGLPDDQARVSLASEFGRTLWNALPLPGNGFRPRPFPRPERNEPCPCGSGLKYKKCCAEWVDAVPALDPESVLTLLVDQLSLEQVEALGESGRVPRTFLGELAVGQLDEGNADRALALVKPLFEKPERLDERDSASLNVLLEAYEDMDMDEERWAEAERLSVALKGPLRAVLWEHLTRAYAVAGEMEAAWKSLERATEDDPASPALGPLEVSLLLAEGRTDEARDRALFWKDRLKGELSEPGMDLLERVAKDPEETQLQFSLGEEVTDRLHRLEKWLAAAPPPAPDYRIEPVAGEPGAGQLVTPADLETAEAGFEAAFYPAEV
ncbi:MAG: SEC-C metal-binding domain-containing protein, partial [Thermoanaerobaculia bacterium]